MGKRYASLNFLFISILFCATATANVTVKSSDDDAVYCKKSGGSLEEMTAEIGTSAGLIKGFTKKFCNFNINGGFIAIGLETFASIQPNIAATFMKKMNEITQESKLWNGPFGNPSANVCKNIGGASISFVANGGFSNPLGQSDICVFGDGSMVSAWSLIYMANHREGYDTVKNQVRSQPLAIAIPS